MRKLERTAPLAVGAFAAVGIAAGLLLQLLRSSRGEAPFVPPVSLPASMLVIAIVLLVLGIMLRRAVTHASSRPVNPFHAVRLLAGARAGQYAGALLGGFGLGLLLQVLSRSVVPAPAHWLPMGFVAFAGVVLVAAGVVAEWLCRVPPEDPETETEEDSGVAPDASPAL